MLNRKGLVQIPATLGLIAVIALIVIGAMWFGGKFGGNQLAITQQRTGGLGGTKTVALVEDTTLTLTTDSRFAASTQPACTSSLYVNGDRIRSDMGEAATETVIPGDVITVYYCSNQTDAALAGWYGMVDSNIEIAPDAGAVKAYAQPCRWTATNTTKTVNNEDDSVNSGAGAQAIGSGGTARVAVSIKAVGDNCYANPDGFIDIVGDYISSVYETIELQNVQVLTTTGTKNFGTITGGSGKVPAQNIVRYTNLSTVAFRVPASLIDSDELEFDVWIKARSGQNPTTSHVSQLNFTLYDTDYYPHTQTGAIGGPDTENNVGTDIGKAADERFSISIS